MSAAAAHRTWKPHQGCSPEPGRRAHCTSLWTKGKLVTRDWQVKARLTVQGTGEQQLGQDQQTIDTQLGISVITPGLPCMLH